MSYDKLNSSIENEKEKKQDSDEEFYECKEAVEKSEHKLGRVIERYQEKFLTRKQQHRDQDRLKYYTKIQNSFASQEVSFNLSGENTQNMSDQDGSGGIQAGGQAGNATPTQVFDSNDPNRAGLSNEQLAYMNQRLNEHVIQTARPSTSIRVTNINPRMDPPYYNPNTMTSDSFFTKCEKYFMSQGYPQAQFHNAVHVILKGNMQLWYDGVVDSIGSWADFKVKFASRFDNRATQEKRNMLLMTRTQTYNDSCEQFILEMVTLAKQINPREDENISVKRAYERLIPDIRKFAGNLDNLTVNSLLEILASTYDTIKAHDRLYGIHTKLPPLHGYSSYNTGVGRGQFRQRSNSLPNANQFRPRFQSFNNPPTFRTVQYAPNPRFSSNSQPNQQSSFTPQFQNVSQPSTSQNIPPNTQHVQQSTGF